MPLYAGAVPQGARAGASIARRPASQPRDQGEGPMDMNAVIQNASGTLMAVAWKVVGAAVLWLVGRWLISFALRLTAAAFTRQKVDLTLTRYIQTALKIVLN